MAATLVQNICCQDTNVVVGLAAVTDAKLQTATETAANGLIGVPIRRCQAHSYSTGSAEPPAWPDGTE